MGRLESRRAELAARLARSIGSRAVVCSGCLAGRRTGMDPITVSRPPLDQPHVELDQILLLVAGADADEELLRMAASAVPEVWLLQEEGLLSALSEPSGGLYRRRTLILPGEKVRLVALPEVEVVPICCSGAASCQKR